MKVKDLIHKLTADGIELDYDVVFLELSGNPTREYKVTSVGVDILNKKVNINNLY